MPIILTSTVPSPSAGDPYPITTLNANQSNTVYEDLSGSTAATANGDLVALMLNQEGSNIFIG